MCTGQLRAAEARAKREREELTSEEKYLRQVEKMVKVAVRLQGGSNLSHFRG